MACNCGCNCCPNLVKSTAVTYVSSSNELNITIPAATYSNHDRICLVITQAIPDTINADTQVNIMVGTSGAYPVFTKYLNYVYADAIQTRKIYPLLVATDTDSFVIENVKRLLTTSHTFGTMPTTSGTDTTPETTG